MKSKTKVLKALAVSLALAMTSPCLVFADTFKDVPATFWAYDAINSISSQGIMLGDLSGNFNPNSFIDKFETSKTLAKVLGYNYSNASQTDKSYYEKIYNDKKTFIDQYEKAFTKWNSTTDREVAFLLEKGILKNEDLNQFVIRNTQGKEQLRALSREEFAVFLVRMMGKTDEAASYSITTRFADDVNINSSKKQSVYYLKSIGVISGGTDGKFNPNNAVTRADFCVLLNNALKVMGKTVNSTTTVDSITSSNANVNNIETITGTLDKYFPSLNVIQVNVSGNQKLYKVTAAAVIKVNGFNSSLSDLKAGMTITAVLNNTEIVQLSAINTENNINNTLPSISETASETTSEATSEINSGTNWGIESTTQNVTTEIPSIETTQSVISNGSINNNGIITATISEDDLTTIEGSVEAVNGNSITLSYSMVNARDEISSQSKTYTLADNVVITRNSTQIFADGINVNDMARAKILGSKIYSIEVEGGSLMLSNAKISKKYYSKAKGMGTLVIETNGGKTYELFVDDDSQISRNSEDETDWQDLKIGDTVSVTTNYNKIVSLKANGETKMIEGYITQVIIGSQVSSIGLSSDEKGSDQKVYPVDTQSVDVYDLKIGDKVKVYLESDEVETVSVRKAAQNNTVTGYVNSKKSSSIIVESSQDGSNKRNKIEFDDDTSVISAVSGKTCKIKDIQEDMKVYVVFDDEDSNLAKTITILSNN